MRQKCALKQSFKPYLLLQVGISDTGEVNEVGLDNIFFYLL